MSSTVVMRRYMYFEKFMLASLKMLNNPKISSEVLSRQNVVFDPEITLKKLSINVYMSGITLCII